MCEALASVPCTCLSGRHWGGGGRGIRSVGHLQLHSRLEGSLGYHEALSLNRQKRAGLVLSEDWQAGHVT